MEYNNGNSSKSGTKKIIISLCVVILAVVAIIVTTVVTTSKNKEEVIDTNALQHVPNSDETDVPNNDKKEENNDTIENNDNENNNEIAQDNKTTNNVNNNTNEDTNIAINNNDNQTQNNNVLNNNNNNNQSNTEFIQKEIVDEKIEKEFKENISSWNEEKVNVENAPSISNIEKADTEAPKITVKGDEEPNEKYVGDIERKIFSKVSFKLSDNYGVLSYKINDGEYIKLTVNKWSDANFDNIKPKLVYGKNTITLKDVAGNETTYEFIYDNKASTITVKDGYVGDKERAIYSKVSFKLYDEYGVLSYKINDGEYTKFNVNNYSDADFGNIRSKLIYGKNTITLRDVAGNETTYEFIYDNKAPTITVKDGYVGDKERAIFSKVSFKLYDEYGVLSYKINDGEYTKFNVNNYSDADFGNIRSRLVYGKNTITLRDVAGNETTYEFTYDNIAPVYKTLGIARNKDKDDTRDQAYAKTGDSIRVLVSFSEKLETEPKVTINGKDYDCTYREKSSNEESKTFYYMADVTITDEMNLPEGEVNFNVHGYADLAGNVGEELNNSKINMNAYPKVIYDKTAPSVKTLGILNLDHFKEGNPNYAKADATIRIYASFNEKLAKLPVVKIAENDYTFRFDSERNGTYIYMMDKKISDINGLEEGLINFEISGYEDLAGNIGETLTQENTNYNGYKEVIYDNTPAMKFSSDFYAVNVTPADKTYYVNNGKTIVINAKFNEMLGNVPKFVLKDSAGKEYILEAKYTGIDNKNDGKGDRFTYTATFVTTEEVAQGELTYTISDIYDVAGNKTEDITKATNGRTVIFDNIAPVHTAINVIGSKYSKEDKAWYVKNNDYVSVYVRFNEEIKNEPVLKIEGIDKEIPLKYSTDKNGVKYGARFQITDEYNNLADGEIKIKISGYEDLAGNKGNVLENKDIKGLESQSKVIIDRTAPVISIDKNIIIECGSEFVDDIREKISDNITQAKDLKVEIYPVNGINVDTNKVGTYQINYKITDKAGNYKVETRTINVVDKAAPEIIFPDNVIGKNNNELYLDAGCDFTLDNLVSVRDNVDPNPTLKITGITYYGGPEAKDNIYGKTEEFLRNGLDTKLTGKTNNCGRYNIDYEATDAVGNKSTRTLLVMFRDKVAPTISIDPSSIGKDVYYSKLVVNANDNAYLAYFEINGAKSTITQDADIIGVSSKSRTFLNDTINGHIKFGEKNTIVAFDRAGNKSNVIEFIADREKPVISINRNVELKVGDKFNEDIYDKISDNVNSKEDLKVGFWPTNDRPLDTNTPGSYSINYKVEDKAGNYEVATRVITVKPNE